MSETCKIDSKELQTKCYEPKQKRVKRSRMFLGKIDNFFDKQERDFEKKHLRAYLRGEKRFIIGYEGYAKIPVYSIVKQRLIQVT